MIKVIIPDNNIAERKYAIDMLMRIFLGLDYTIEAASSPEYRICLANSKQLVIEDHFFKFHPQDTAYRTQANIPEQITFGKLPFLAESDIPIIYGNDKAEIEADGITLGLDIFASSFFMLSRWEEYVVPVRDRHDRFPASGSLAGNNNLLSRPIVNEYAELLWNALLSLDGELKRPIRVPRILVSCDVDFPYDSARHSLVRTLKRTAGRLLRSNLGQYHYPLMNYFAAPDDMQNDLLWRRVKWIMEVNEEVGNKVAFNFLPLRTCSEFDDSFSSQDPIIRKQMKEVVQRGHELGFHPGYESYNDVNLFNASLKTYVELLKDDGIQADIVGGRQHFLRWSFPETLRLWEHAGFSYDSTLGYADHPGFRCGTCYEYPLFDVISRQQLKLQERPLVLMEGSVINDGYLGLGRTDASRDLMLQLKTTCLNYCGDFTLLWHNSAFVTSFDEDIYRNLIRST